MSNETIQNREPLYGNFANRSRIAIGIKNAMHIAQGWSQLSDAQKQALDTIADKISRILNGDPNHVDSWHDIGGYAQLVEQDIEIIGLREKQQLLFKFQDLPGVTVEELRPAKAGEFDWPDGTEIPADTEVNAREKTTGTFASGHPAARIVTGPALPVDKGCRKNEPAIMCVRPKEGCTCYSCRPDLFHGIYADSCHECGTTVGRPHLGNCKLWKRSPRDQSV